LPSPPAQHLHASLSQQAAALTLSKDDALVEAVLKGGHHLSLADMNALLKQLHFERLQRLAAAQDGSQGT
jgi:prolyl-tRNA editing enzyme YbaK/EbsC (Cys-tRNA(Pro) deacylase)